MRKTVLPKLLLVDDDEELCRQMRWALAENYNVFVATDRQDALDIFKRERPAVVTLDLGLPPDPHGVSEGFCTLHDILHEDAGTKVIVITGREERQHAREAVGQGAYDFFRKPIALDELSILMRRALHVYQLEQEHWASYRKTHQEVFEGMLGASPQMQEVFETIRRVATADVPVLISGESGTGKELVARAIQQRSVRQDGPFVAINCGAIPENLLESELFGHEKGAFTGAHAQRKGRIELAQGGTLFLDEIGELSLPLQVKLLRFLQEHQIERVGGHKTLQVDVRVLAATNVDLACAIADGRFREDLYYRLGVVSIALPPLRDREGDVVMLARALLERYAIDLNSHTQGFDRLALVALQRYQWPGNVRELENRIKRAMIMARGAHLTADDLELALSSTRSGSSTLKEVRETVEKQCILEALAHNQANVTHTATALGISRATLHDLLTKYAIKR
jgi:two-component system NtrC family response regulator